MDDTPDDGRRALILFALSAAGLGTVAKMLRKAAPVVERDLRYGVPLRATTIRAERELPVDKAASLMSGGGGREPIQRRDKAERSRDDHGGAARRR